MCLHAAVAANLALVGLGTDTGNSVRGPASHCNLVGMRPTLGLTSRLATLLIRLSLTPNPVWKAPSSEEKQLKCCERHCTGKDLQQMTVSADKDSVLPQVWDYPAGQHQRHSGANCQDGRGCGAHAGGAGGRGP